MQFDYLIYFKKTKIIYFMEDLWENNRMALPWNELTVSYGT